MDFARRRSRYRRWGAFLAGMGLGLLVLAVMRVSYYEAMGYRPNMAPQIA